MAFQQRLVNKQFNSPINLYSHQNIQDVLERDTQILSNGAVGINFHNPAAGKPTNLKNSAVLRMLEEEENRQRNGFSSGIENKPNRLQDRLTWPPPEYDRNRRYRSAFRDTVISGTKRVAWPPLEGENNDQSTKEDQGGSPFSSTTAPVLTNKNIPRPVPESQTRSPLQPLNISCNTPSLVGQPSPKSPNVNKSPVGFSPKLPISPNKTWSHVPPSNSGPQYTQLSKPFPSSNQQYQSPLQYQSPQYNPATQYQTVPQYQPTQYQPAAQYPTNQQCQPVQQHHSEQYFKSTQQYQQSLQYQHDQQNQYPPQAPYQSPDQNQLYQQSPQYQPSVGQNPNFTQRYPGQSYQPVQAVPTEASYPQAASRPVEPPPTTITLRPQAPVSQRSPPVFNSQPATATLKGGKNLRGDLKWPPESVKKQSEEENRLRVELAKGPVCRPRRPNKDYSGFFAQHALNSTYPGYKAPPGTQYYGATDY